MSESTIIVDDESHSDFAITGYQKTIKIGKIYGGEIAIVGDNNTIATKAEQTNTALAGHRVNVNVTASNTSTAMVGRSLTANITGVYPKTAVVGDDGEISIKGNGCETSACLRRGEANIIGDSNQTAICSARRINIDGDYNDVAIVSDNTVGEVVIRCSGTRNRIVCLGTRVVFSGHCDNWIMVGEYNNKSYDEEEYFLGFVSGCIGKNGLKENTLYTVRDGQFVELPKDAAE